MTDSKTANSDLKVNLIGHPFVPIGMGEHIRNSFRSLASIGHKPSLTDIYKLEQPEPAELAEFGAALTDSPGQVNIYHINGNEVDQALKHLSYKRDSSGFNIVYPLWELGIYPAEWASLLDRFDAIWAPSGFIFDSLKQACTKPVVHMPIACQVQLNGFLPRRYFGIPEADYIFLFFYDLRSYSTRKNPQAVIEVFRRLKQSRPYSKTHLVLKVNGVSTNPDTFTALKESLADLRGNVSIFHQTMTSDEVKNLTRCADCFVSLHRSEGFGLGIAEAMTIGKPVIATAYSGNMEFMTEQTSLGVGYSLVPLKEGDYPFWSDQSWADPDLDQALHHMLRLVDEPTFGTRIGKLARQHMHLNFSYKATGLRILGGLRANTSGA